MIVRQAHHRMVRHKRGFTLIEIIIVVAITGILAGAFSSVFTPVMTFFFYYPQASNVQAAAADLLQAIIDGDNRAKGLRYTGLPCTIGGGGGGGSTITAATTTSITYNYIEWDYCGTGAARTSHTVVLTLDTGNDVVTRTIDGGAASNIPSYVTTSSNIDFNAPGGANFFHYFDAAGTDLGGTPAVANIMRVDINVVTTTGSGEVRHGSGQVRLESGVEINRYTT